MTFVLPNRRTPQRTIGPAIAVLCVVGVIFGGGCHRNFYRRQADLEANCLIDQKAVQIARPPNQALRITPDRRSRYFNPFDLDFQPRPIDDPAAHQYVQCVDGRRGYPLWDAAGITNAVESPDWWQFLPMDADGILTLNAENAVRIAILHSPLYQFQLEQLYLSALTVSAQRFEFDTQFFAGAEGLFDFQGDGRSQFRTGTFGRGRAQEVALQRRFATGGTLVAGLANNIIFELSNPSSQSATTLLDFSLVQPLLRRGGRDVVLEGLTLSERQLLARVRDFERFRRNFFLLVTTGRGIDSGVDQIGLGAPGDDIDGGLGITGAGLGSPGGFLDLLQTQIEIRNNEENLARLSEVISVFEANLIELETRIPDQTAEDIVNLRLQIAQTQSTLNSNQIQLVNQKASYELAKDRFLRDLGLPPYICVRIEDDLLNRFNLVERRLLRRREEVTSSRRRIGQINVALLNQSIVGINAVTDLPERRFEWNDAIAADLKQLSDAFEPLDRFYRELLDVELPRIAADVEILSERLPRRLGDNRRFLEIYSEKERTMCGLLNIGEVDEAVFDNEDLDGLDGILKKQLTRARDRLKAESRDLEKLRAAVDELVLAEGDVDSIDIGDLIELDDDPTLSDIIGQVFIFGSQQIVGALSEDVLALQLIQARARTESITLPPVDLDASEAFRIASQYRRDYMNARASLFDAYRNIEVIADDLESDLDFVVSGGIANDGNNPFSLRDETASLRVGLQFDAPITRLLERNDYRAALIQYERTKRDFYQFEDGLWEVLRGEIRSLQASKLNFELSRASLRLAASQVELNNDLRLFRDARGFAARPNAARDQIQALSDLLGAQNTLLNTFIGYEVTRRSLDFDLGTMELTPEGLWLDPENVSRNSDRESSALFEDADGDSDLDASGVDVELDGPETDSPSELIDAPEPIDAPEGTDDSDPNGAEDRDDGINEGKSLDELLNELSPDNERT